MEGLNSCIAIEPRGANPPPKQIIKISRIAKDCLKGCKNDYICKNFHQVRFCSKKIILKK